MKDRKDAMITIRLKPEELQLVIEWGRAEPDLPSKPEVVRRMIAAAYNQRKAERKRR